MNRIWNFRDTTPKGVSTDWAKIVQSDPKDLLLDSFEKIIQDQVEIIDRKNDIIADCKRREALYVEKIKRLVDYAKRLVEERTNAGERTEKEDQ